MLVLVGGWWVQLKESRKALTYLAVVRNRIRIFKWL